MKIEELDEFQGLTAEMVREWLHNLDPSIKPSASMADDIAAVSELCGETPQALLREINPRMRKGMPSDAALAEHDEWIVCTPFGATFIAEISYGGSDDGFSIMMPPINDHCDAEFIAEKHWPECLFWPCDEHGNKVRWPVDAEGKML